MPPATTRKGQVVGETIETQTQVVFETIEWILDDAGATLLDVVRCGVFLADLGDLTGFNVVYRRAFGDRLPARTTVGAFLPGYRVEIDCIAAIPSNQKWPIDETADATGQSEQAIPTVVAVRIVW